MIAQEHWMAPRRPNRAMRLADLGIATVLIILTSPLMALTALAIKLDSSGPIFTRERRVDGDGRQFAALKFRTTQYRPLVDTRTFQHLDAGSAITRLGGFLRQTRIDNLPQLLNVLRGEMVCVVSAGSGRLFFLE
jgi:lipopolysaccharide/colanic/teichoic acid biosynthesis glycosyltransferase